MSEKMNAVAILNEKKIEIIDILKPDPKPHQIRIRIRACALCTYEQRVYTGVSKMPYPFIGGHEISGEIDEVGKEIDADKYKIGTKVTARILYKCGTCYYCRHGKENLCTEANKSLMLETGISGVGGLSQYIVVEPSQIWILPSEMSYENAALSEPIACVVNSIEKANPQLGDDAVILGGGIMGMLHLICLKLKGVRTILCEPIEQRRLLAMDLGCAYAIDPNKSDPIEDVLKITGGRGAEVVFNTTAVSKVAEQAIQMTGALGRCIMYSSQHPDIPISVSANKLHQTEMQLTGAVSPSVHSFDVAVNLLKKNLVQPEKLISGIYNYTDAQKAFEEAVQPNTYRIVIVF